MLGAVPPFSDVLHQLMTSVTTTATQIIETKNPRKEALSCDPLTVKTWKQTEPDSCEACANPTYSNWAPITWRLPLMEWRTGLKGPPADKWHANGGERLIQWPLVSCGKPSMTIIFILKTHFKDLVQISKWLWNPCNHSTLLGSFVDTTQLWRTPHHPFFQPKQQEVVEDTPSFLANRCAFESRLVFPGTVVAPLGTSSIARDGYVSQTRSVKTCIYYFVWSNVTWEWEIIVISRTYIYKWRMFPWLC